MPATKARLIRNTVFQVSFSSGVGFPAISEVVKAPKKMPRPIQLKRHEELRKLGFKVYVLDSKEEIEKILDEIEGGRKDGISTI